jgi:hypothetical protein
VPKVKSFSIKFVKNKQKGTCLNHGPAPNDPHTEIPVPNRTGPNTKIPVHILVVSSSTEGTKLLIGTQIPIGNRKAIKTHSHMHVAIMAIPYMNK